MLQDSLLLQHKMVKISPHIIDSTLLVSALLMLYVGHWSVIENSWLMVKISVLILYVGLGVYALKRGSTKTIRCIFWVLGLLAFMYIVSVALTKSAMGFIGYIVV